MLRNELGFLPFRFVVFKMVSESLLSIMTTQPNSRLDPKRL